MRVGLDEPRQHGPPPEVDDAGVGPRQRQDLGRLPTARIRSWAQQSAVARRPAASAGAAAARVAASDGSAPSNVKTVPPWKTV